MNVKIQQEIQDGLESPFPLMYVEQSTVKKKKKNQHTPPPPKKNTRKILRRWSQAYTQFKKNHFIPFELTCHRISSVLWDFAYILLSTVICCVCNP